MTLIQEDITASDYWEKQNTLHSHWELTVGPHYAVTFGAEVKIEEEDVIELILKSEAVQDSLIQIKRVHVFRD
jgi:hypothetical protein